MFLIRKNHAEKLNKCQWKNSDMEKLSNKFQTKWSKPNCWWIVLLVSRYCMRMTLVSLIKRKKIIASSKVLPYSWHICSQQSFQEQINFVLNWYRTRYGSYTLATFHTKIGSVSDDLFPHLQRGLMNNGWAYSHYWTWQLVSVLRPLFISRSLDLPAIPNGNNVIL